MVATVNDKNTRRLEKRLAFVAAQMRIQAATSTFDGTETPENLCYLARCKHDDYGTGYRIIFTRDTGMHSSGWFKNPDYERCMHLSLSPHATHFGHGVTGSIPWNEPESGVEGLWVVALFGEHARLAWRESPKTRAGKELEVVHWRVFCDEHWQPILPRKEVYSKDFTERGWKSFSELGIAIGSPLRP